MTRLATLSSIGLPRKIILSFSRREKISYALSPIPVFSMTIGTSVIFVPFRD